MRSPVPAVLRRSRPTWLSPKVARTEVLAGLVVALALIPEAISFSVLAGVAPQVGLFASFTMAVTIAFTGGRPAMISAATGAVPWWWGHWLGTTASATWSPPSSSGAPSRCCSGSPASPA